MMVKLVPVRVLLLLLVLWATGSDAQIDVCGRAPLNSKTDSRIVGGQDASEGAWPWQASLEIRDGLCGGSLINNQWVLSAAHCFSSTSTSGVSIYLGRHNRGNPLSSNELRRGASRIIIHEDYDSKPFDNDIALVQLDSTVDFTDYIQPVCLAAEGSAFPDGLDCWVTGWGTIQTGVSLPAPQTLQEVDIPIMSNSRCASSYNTLTDNMVCAGLSAGGKDACQGDSGGPLVTKNGSVWVQAGIVSFGRGCAEPDFPGVYARVSKYQSWINNRISTNQPGFINFQGSTGAATFVSISLPLLLSVPPAVFSFFVLS